MTLHTYSFRMEYTNLFFFFPMIQGLFGSAGFNSIRTNIIMGVIRARVLSLVSSPVIYVHGFGRPIASYYRGRRSNRRTHIIIIIYSVLCSCAKSSRVPSVSRPCPNHALFASRERISLNWRTVHVCVAPGFSRRRVNYVVVTKQCLFKLFLMNLQGVSMCAYECIACLLYNMYIHI